MQVFILIRRQLLCVFSFILCCLFPGFIIAQSNYGTALTELKAEVKKLGQDKDLEHAIWSITVQDLKTGELLVGYNSAVGLVPASSLKTVTTATALCLLGAEYRYKTNLQYDGNLDTLSGVLNGNLYIFGSGDPTLDSKYFYKEGDSVSVIQKWAAALKAKNIKRIEGAVIADASIFEDEVLPPTWIWGDIGNYFGAGPCGLSFKDNLYTVNFNSGASGELVHINTIKPGIPGLSVYNKVRAGGSTDNANLFGVPYSNEHYATGTIPPGKVNFEVNGSMPDPAWFCAYALDSVLKSSNVEIKKSPVTVRQLKLKGVYNNFPRISFYATLSPPLNEIVYWTNRKSVNLFAEHLLRSLPLKGVANGTLDDGIKVLTDFWESKGMDTGGLYLNDGSGLSRWNSISTSQMVYVLRYMQQSPFYENYFTSLPVYNSSVSAKSGYITRVRSYTGYATRKNGDVIAFSVIANNYACSATQMRKKLERLMDLIGKL